MAEEWAKRNIPVELTIIDSPYREVTTPLIDYIRTIQRDSPRDVVCVYIPEYVVDHWWEHLLHNQSALRLKARLLFTPGVMVTNVPYHLASSHHLITSDAEHPLDVAVSGRLTEANSALRALLEVRADPLGFDMARRVAMTPNTPTAVRRSKIRLRH